MDSNIKIQHAFTDDALGTDDSTELQRKLTTGQTNSRELVAAAIHRAELLEPRLNAIAYQAFDQATASAQQQITGFFAGIPSIIKDNLAVAGMPSQQGTNALKTLPAKRSDPFVEQFLQQGFICLGKSKLPEFGLNASTEYGSAMPHVNNPWANGYSAGGSSGGSAALVAAGVIPMAHANDGGGSIRIPAACCGLVGLKPTRGRHILSKPSRDLPIDILNEGVLTRSVRDTAQFYYHQEKQFRNPKLPEIGLVERPSSKRLRIGVVETSFTGQNIDVNNSQALQKVANELEVAGHHLQRINPTGFTVLADDFLLYWGFLAFAISRFGHRLFPGEFDPNAVNALTKGMATRFKSNIFRTPLVLFNLSRTTNKYKKMFAEFDVLLSPVLCHPPPPIGFLDPQQEFAQLIEKLVNYVGFTPLANAAGTPAISLPLASTDNGLPIGIQLSGHFGEERRLIELAYELEERMPFRQIYRN